MNIADNRVMALAGCWEPLAFQRRRGGWVADDERRHAELHAPATVEKLQALGVTTVVWPGYKGLGIERERAEWDWLKPFRKLVERAGIEFGVYLQAGSYFAETFYEETPAAREWTAIDFWGKPQVYSEYYRAYYRHRPCLTHRGFSEYVARAAQILVKEYGATFFYADNNAQVPCYTEHFRQAFIQFLKHKYGTQTAAGMAQFIRRYGHSHVENIVLPSGSARRPIEALHALPDPAMQDWVEFRCRLVARNAEIITTSVKSVNRGVRLCYNLSYDCGEFSQLVWGTEPELISPHADFLFSEDGHAPRVTSDGRLVSHVHTCKHLRAMGQRGHFHPPKLTDGQASRDAAVLSLMELAVHNQGCLGPLWYNDFDLQENDPTPSTVRFIRQHEDIFTNNTSVAEIAVLRSRHSGTINWLEATTGRLLAQQALFQAGFQWDNVIETTLDQLQKYRLLVLPDTISVPTDCLAAIAEYVRGGGRVLAVGSALSCDEWGRQRSLEAPPVLNGERNADYGYSPQSKLARAALAAWLGVEAPAIERLFVFPRLLHPRPIVWDPDDPRAPVLGSAHHALPLNFAEFSAAVQKSLAQPPLVEFISGERSPYVVPSLLRANDGSGVSLHVLDYQCREQVGPLTLRLNLPALRAVSQMEVLSLETREPGRVQLAKEAHGLTLSLPAFRHYLGCVLHL